MNLQNRIDPWGTLKKSSARGAWLGNRGILHNENKEIVAPWRHKAWIICSLEFKGRKREIFSSNSYSELFFLDEATALSAGHRPCAECRRARFNEFKSAWCKVNDKETSIPVSQIDKQLHSERMTRDGKGTFAMEFSKLPEGAFIEIGNAAFLFWQGKLKRWSFDGYATFDYNQPAPSELVKVLTPFSIVQVLQHGFRPQVHESAMR